MTVTVQQCMNRSLKMLVAIGAESSVSASDSEDYIFALNNFMAEMESGQYDVTEDSVTTTYGIDLGWTEVDSVSDTVTIPRGGIEGLCACMAFRLASEYGVVVTPDLAKQASDGLTTLIRIGQNLQGATYPTTLPFGSGNEDDGANYGSGHFYPI